MGELTSDLLSLPCLQACNVGKFLWSFAELWASYCKAVLQASIVHGGVCVPMAYHAVIVFSRKGPVVCSRVLASSKHCCLQHCSAKQTNLPSGLGIG